MSVAIVIVILIAVAATGVAAGYWLPHDRRRSRRERPPNVTRVLFPFTSADESRDAFESALRLAKAEHATLVATFLERVPRDLSLDVSPVGHECRVPAIDAIERRAAARGVPVDCRTARGRTHRDALRRLLAQEAFDQVFLSATDSVRIGLSGRDSAWLLEQAAGEVVILPPAHDGNGGSRAATSPDLRDRGERGAVP